MSEFRVDVGHFRMIVDLYDRKCPCWGGKNACPCTPFAELKNCRCGAVRAMDDPKGQNARFKDYRVNFQLLAEITRNGHRCPEDAERICFCREFLESGECKLKLFEKSDDST